MSRAFTWMFVVAVAGGAGVAVRAQATAPPPGSAPPQAAGSGFATSTTAVVVDVVVRDQKGAPVVDLKAADFELLEDEARQRVTSVQLVAPGRAASVGARTHVMPTTPAASPVGEAGSDTSASDPAPTLIALAFHRLSPEARMLAYRAARSYVDGSIAPNDLAGVFIVDTDLQTIQTFTTDRAKLSAAVERVARTQTTTFTRNPPMAGGYGDANPDVSPTASADSAGRPANESGFQPRPRQNTLSNAAQGSRMLQEMAERMENTYEELMRDRNGHLETAALTALASSMGQMPGRKTVVFFSEGLSVPAAIEAKFRAVIETANRSNVSFYTVDAKGLKVHSEQAATARGLAALRGVGDDDFAKVEDDDRRKARTTDLERNEFLLRKDPAVTLGTLARETGGFLIDNTNDLASAFQRIDADRRFHYLLTYTPSNTAQDGSFRRIAVKVKRRQVTVRARSGYVAVPALGTVPVLRFESNVLSALAASPRPTKIAMDAATFQFPEAEGRTRVTLFVKVPGSGVAYFVDDKQTTYQTHFTILARVVDDTGEVVRKGSQPYRLSGPAKDVHVARQGDILFYRQPTLDPGHYALEYALYDELSGEAGTGTLPLDVPTRDPSALAMSSLLLVDHAEAVPADQKDPANPLYFGTTLIYPNLGGPVARSRRASLVFFYAARAGGRPLTGRVELRQDQRVVATREMTVPAADATGLVQHANELPLDGIDAGPYELSVTLSDGRTSASRSTAFTLQP